MESRTRGLGRWLRRRKSLFARCAVALTILFLCTSHLFAQETTGNIPPESKAPLPSILPTANSTANADSPASVPTFAIPDMTKKETFSSAMQIIILLTVLSLAPAILIMMTSFTRIVIVFSLLRQAMGTQQLPPNQILIGLSLFMTFLVMGPTWQKVNDQAIQPYMAGTLDQKTALADAVMPVREFMENQIQINGNDKDVFMLQGFATNSAPPKELQWKDVSTITLIPAFMLSELKTAFIMGFKIYLPFLIIDIVISTILISMGMMMLPPVLISLPFKLLLFVLVDGWHLITSSLISSFVK
jgi:flagellar biosynthetic protein FliP